MKVKTMNKKVVWAIVAIVVIVGIILLATMGNDKVSNTPGGTELPDTTQAQYNNLATSTGDFAALEEATEQLS